MAGFDPLTGQPYGIQAGQSAFPGMSATGFSMGLGQPSVGAVAPPSPATVPTSAAIGAISPATPAAPTVMGALGNILAGDPSAGVPQPQGIGQALGGMVRNADGSFNMQGLGMLAGGLQTLGSMWQTWQAGKATRDAMNFQKEAYQTNLENSEQTYNTNLEASTHTRYATEGRSKQAANDYIRRHSL